MSEKSGIDLNNIILIGALIGGGYLIIKYLLPSFKGLSSISDAVGAVTQAPADLLTAITQPTGTITPQNVSQKSTELGTYGATVTLSNILTNPIGSMLAGFQQLPNLISAVKIGVSPTPKTDGTTTPKINGPQTASKYQPLTMVTAPAGAKAQIPSLALSTKLRGLA